MAKLSANGTELGRYSKNLGTHVQHLSVRSNGWILKKNIWNTWNSGWKRMARCPMPGADYCRALVQMGWTPE